MRLNSICESILSEESSNIIKDLILKGLLRNVSMLKDLGVHKMSKEEEDIIFEERGEYIGKLLNEAFDKIWEETDEEKSNIK